MYIYMLRNKANGKVYIGQTRHACVNVRLGQHRNSHKYPNSANFKTAITRAIKKYGWDCFDRFVLERCDSDTALNAAEVFWIEFYSSTGPAGYNLTLGGGFYTLSEDARKARSERMMGHEVSEETKRRIGNANRGRVQSAEACRKKGDARRGQVMSDHNKRRLREACGDLPCANAKLTWDKVREIRAKYATGNFTQYDLAPMYGVSVATISRIVKNKIWQEPHHDQAALSSSRTM